MRQTATTLGAFRSADIATIPIATGVLTITSAYTIAQAESSTTDDIDTITPSLNGISATDAYFVMIEADAGDTLTLKHGTGNLTLKGAADIELTGGQRALLFGSLADGFTDFATSSAGGGGSGAISADTLVLNDGSEVTIATGAITVTAARHTVDTEADAASDDLITVNGLAANEVCIVTAAHTDRTIVVKNGGGNISSATGADITLDDDVKAVALMGNIAGTGVNAYPLQSSGSGGIGGSTGATDNRLLRADGTAGATVQSSGITVDDSANMSGLNTLGFVDAAELTISAGAVTRTATYHRIDTEADAASDDLDTISDGTAGQKLILRAENTARTVTVRHNGGGTGNIRTFDGNNVVLDETYKAVELIFDGTNWLVISSGAIAPFTDATALVKGSADDSKQFRIEVDGFTAGQTRVATPPDEDFTMVGVATAQTLTNKILTQLKLSDATELTISSGAVTRTQAYHTIDTEADAASDDLDTISGGAAGDVLYIAANNDARTVVVKNGTGNILTYDGSDISLDEDHKIIELLYNGTNWRVVGVTSVGSGGALATVNATKVYKPPSNISVTSMSYVNVDATNYAITETMIGDGVVMLTLLFLANKATAGTGTLRWTDGTNFSAEFVISFATIVSYVFVASMPTTAGSTTYTLQAKSSDGNALNIRETNPINISLVEVY